MREKLQISKRFAAVLVYGRPPLVFGGMLCAIGVMLNRNPTLYTLGVVLLFAAMCFDLVDGWFSARFRPASTLSHLADRIMDKIVYSIIFPLVAVGVMWRLLHISPKYTPIELLHAIFILFLCITVLIRDAFAQFMRGFAIRKGQEPELVEFTRLRTIVAAPVGAILYAHAFYVPEGPPTELYSKVSSIGNLPLRALFLIEITFLIINFGSITRYCKKYGALCLDELCLGNEKLRRSILSVFPNALTVMNAVMGLMAVFFAYQERIREAYLFLIGATLFDKLDGALARKLGLTEPLPGEGEAGSGVSLGGILDDIADAVSFCIVPAWIYYITLADFPNPLIQALPVGIIAVMYAVMGFVRLTYFTLDKNPIPGFFKGFPTPAAALLVMGPLIAFNEVPHDAHGWIQFWGVFCFGLMIATSILMNLYPVRYLHMGRWMSRNPLYAGVATSILFASVLTPYLGHVALIFAFTYVLSPFVTKNVDPKVAAREG